MGWAAVPTSANNSKQKVTIPTIQVKEAGYIYIYLSYESESNKYVYFDDFKVTHTKSNVVQYNEYYPYGLQTAQSWTRDDAMPNHYLYNQSSELNQATQAYEMPYRQYDPALGRMLAVDPMASKYSSLTPYNYAFNNPVTFNDPSGAEPPQTIRQDATISYWYTSYTYDDIVHYHDRGEFFSNDFGKVIGKGYSGPGSGRYWSDWEHGPMAGFTPLLHEMMTSSGEFVPMWTIKYIEYADGVIDHTSIRISLDGFVHVGNGQHNSEKQGDRSSQTGERPDLGYIGNQIRDRAGSEFSKDMFENYWLGKGDLSLSKDRFLSIWSAAMDVDSKRMAAKGKKYVLANGATVFSKTINFYKSEEYKNALGRATLIFDTNDIVIGFYDYYNFDAKKGARSTDAEIKTRMVREASRLSNAMPFRIAYGIVPLEILRSFD